MAGRLSGTESAAALEAITVITYPLIHMLNSKRNVQPRPLGLAKSGPAKTRPAGPAAPPLESVLPKKGNYHQLAW